MRWAERAFVGEGTEIVGCALAAGATPEALFVAAEARGDHEVAELAAWTLDNGARVFTLAAGVADRIADTVTPHPVFGVFAMTDRPLEDLAHPTLAVACVDVRDPGNAGTVLRSADAAGVGAVLFCGTSVDPFNPKTVRSSAGSIFHVPLAVVPEPLRALGWLSAAGLAVYAADPTGTDYAGLELVAPCAFVLGNEAAGLPDTVRNAADAVVAIPMVGGAESLNVAVSCAVLCFEAARQRRSVPSRPTGADDPVA
jgi:TrmH family RNA methyltransferase